MDIWNDLGKNIKLVSIIDNIPVSFMNDMKHINTLIYKEQSNYINNTIHIIENPYEKNTNEYTEAQQITFAKKWCETYKIPMRKCYT